MTRKTLTTIAAAGAGLILAAGCDLISIIIPEPGTTFRVINDADFPVEFDLYYGDEQNAPEAVLVEFGESVQRTLEAGGVYSETINCDELQAIVIDDADLRVIGGIGPETDTGVYRDGDDFGCGDTITFRFTSDSLGTSIDVDVSIN